MKILLGDFNEKVGREKSSNRQSETRVYIKLVMAMKFEQQTSPHLKTYVVKSTMFLYRRIHKYTYISPEGNAHNQDDHVMVDRRRDSSVLDVRSLRGADCHTDHYLVVAEVRERLAVSKRAAQKIDTETFILKKFNEGDVKEQYQVTVRNKSAAVENLENSEDINRAWDNITENIKISAQESLRYCESKHRIPCFDEECSKLFDLRKQAELQWLLDPNEANEGNLSDVKREASRHFRNKKWECLKEKINELDSNSKNKNIRDLYRGISEFKKGYQPRRATYLRILTRF
jgi:hypothetical protein